MLRSNGCGLDIGGQGFEAAMGVSGEKVGLRLAGKYSDLMGISRIQHWVHKKAPNVQFSSADQQSLMSPRDSG